MATIYPFAALRPHPEQARSVAALPYDVMSAEEACEMAEGNPRSFLHVDKAEIDLDPELSPYDAAVYAKARENLVKLADDGILIKEENPCLYIYRLTAGGRTQTGLAACTSVDEYDRGIIKKHELTRKVKEQDRIDHINACGAHTGPIFITYRGSDTQPCDLMRKWTEKHLPAYDFTAEDGVQHTLWVVDEPAAISALCDAFAAIPQLYIADGHHRSAAASAVAKQHAGHSEAGKFLSVIFPHDELTIMDYNRLVRDLNGLTPEAFLAALADDFTVTESAQPVKPDRTHHFGLYLAGKWYNMAYKHPAPTDAVEGLAVSVLQNRVLAPMLGIHDPQTDVRIDFVGGIRGTEGLVKRVDSGEMAVAFSLCPTTLPELMAVADAGRIMPPKSTWFEPKLRSGLLIHPF